MACWISEPLILRMEEAGSGLSLPSRRRSAATTRNCVISSALSSISTAATLAPKSFVGEKRLAVGLLDRGGYSSGGGCAIWKCRRGRCRCVRCQAGNWLSS